MRETASVQATAQTVGRWSAIGMTFMTELGQKGQEQSVPRADIELPVRRLQCPGDVAESVDAALKNVLELRIAAPE